MLIKHHCYISTIGGKMESSLENLISEHTLNLKEILSSIVLLQQAIQNEYAEIKLKDIDNHLEIIIEKLNDTIINTDEIEKTLFFDN